MKTVSKMSEAKVDNAKIKLKKNGTELSIEWPHILVDRNSGDACILF